MSTLSIDVVGTPAPQGSKRGFYNKNLNRVQMVESSKKVAPWRQDVVAAALNTAAETGWEAPTGPVSITIHFRLPRPRYHYGSGKNANTLRGNAPAYVDKKPDLDKLVRSTLDALTSSGVIRDDAQVAILALVKKYAAPGQSTGAAIDITSITTPDSVAAAPAPSSAAATVQEALL